VPRLSNSSFFPVAPRPIGTSRIFGPCSFASVVTSALRHRHSLATPVSGPCPGGGHAQQTSSSVLPTGVRPSGLGERQEIVEPSGSPAGEGHHCSVAPVAQVVSVRVRRQFAANSSLAISISCAYSMPSSGRSKACHRAASARVGKGVIPTSVTSVPFTAYLVTPAQQQPTVTRRAGVAVASTERRRLYTSLYPAGASRCLLPLPRCGVLGRGFTAY
jgi:hypothetical protein